MAEPLKLQTTAELYADSTGRDLLEEILADLHPALTPSTRTLESIFDRKSAEEFQKQLVALEELFQDSDTYTETVYKLQGQIDKAELIRDELLERVFTEIRPIERTYRQIQLFFENSKVMDGKVRKPVELYLLDADPSAMKDVFSTSVPAMENFIRQRNDNFNFRDDICNLVVPGKIPQTVREKFEDIANQWGMLLIGDVNDEKNFKSLERQFRPGGDYEFMLRPEDRAAADVLCAGYLQLRPAHWFEKNLDGGDDLWGPPSVSFAGAIARTDDGQSLAQGPIGSRFGQISGVDKVRFEPLIGEMEHMTMERQLIPVIRDADNHLCFFGCRTQAYDPDGVLKFFTSYRILRYLERCCRHYLLQVAGMQLTRDNVIKQVEEPLERLLRDQVELGTIHGFNLFIDKDANKFMQGICDITLDVIPTASAETFILKIDVPTDFQKGSSESA